MSTSSNRRRSMSVSAAAPYLSQSDTTTSTSSSLWNNNNKSTKTNFLSRFKSPPHAVPTPSKSTSTHYMTTSLPPIHGQQQQQRIKRKPIVSNVSSSGTTSTSTSTTTSTSSVPRKKYEALLGIRTEDLISEGLNSKKKSSGHAGKGFGNIFKKKRSKSLDKKVNGDHIGALFYQTHKDTTTAKDQDYVIPPVEPFARTNNNQIIYTSPIKAPIVNQSMDDKPVLLANNHVYKPQYHQYEIGQQPSAYSRSKAAAAAAAVQQEDPPPPSPPTNETPRWSTGSARKSTGSYSIYSTFGAESIYEDGNDSMDNVISTVTTPDAEPASVTDLVSIVANNMQTRHPARRVTEESSIHERSEDEDDSISSFEDDDDQSTNNRQSDVFVDATDMSLEDIEREKMEARLSKRLSGGHFGSAGGLMISILASTSTETKAQKRTSRPPPEDVVQSMINWKRHSGHGSTKYSVPDQQPTPTDEEQSTTDKHDQAPPIVPEKDVPVAKSRSLLPQRPLPPNPNILLTTTQEADNEEDDQQDEPIEITDTTEQASDDPKQCASRLWEEDESFVQRERIAEWLGQSKELNASTLNEYMNYFDFATMRLDSAFRKVCSKLYFRAEAQQIDRILEAFAKRYWQCNPKTIFGSADIVYAVVYSLLLLNTDLHVAQGNYTRMTRQAFVKNTMSTIKDQQQTDPTWAAKKPNFMLAWEAHIEAYLKDMYISVKNYQILQPMQQQQQQQHNSLDESIDDNAFLSVSTSTSSNNKRMSIMGGKRMIDIKRSLNTMIHKNGSTRESMLFPDEPSPRKSSSSNTRQQYSASPHSSSRSMHSNHRRDSFCSSHSNSGTLSPKSTVGSSNGSQLSPHPSHMMHFMDTHSADLFANRPPYLKEGVVMRKHLLESANQKAKHREWRECLLVVGQGELKMYGLQSENSNDSNSISSSGKRNVLRASSASFANLADTLSKNYQNVTNIGSTSNPNVTLSYGGVASQDSAQRWGAYSQLMGSIELNHSLSNALPPPGYNKSRPHVFAIQEPNGGVYLIQATSNEQVVEWVSTCNYWAARQSKEPLQGGVGNLEYGWGSCLNDVILDLDAVESGEKITGKYFHDPDAVSISHWIPPAPTMVSSILDEKAQLDSLQAYVNQLNEDINEHREIKRKIMVKQKGQNHTRALANWESKSKYMLHEIIKYQNYCDSLEKSIQSREAAEQEGQEEEEEEES